MAWAAPIDVTFCGCESGSHTSLTICDQFACPNGPKLTTPTPCPSGFCAWPTNPSLGQCTPRSVTIPAGDDPVDTRVHKYCLCAGQSIAVPLLTGCDGSLVCPNQIDLVTDKAAYDATAGPGCTQQLPSMSFWDTCVYTSRTMGVLESLLVSTESCLCNLADNKGVTGTWDPVAVDCSRSLCHNSAPLKRRAVAHDGMEIPILLPPSIFTAVTPLIPITTEATPGSLLTANPGPTSVPTSG
jgi:hypothetical protein